MGSRRDVRFCCRSRRARLAMHDAALAGAVKPARRPPPQPQFVCQWDSGLLGRCPSRPTCLLGQSVDHIVRAAAGAGRRGWAARPPARGGPAEYGLSVEVALCAALESAV